MSLADNIKEKVESYLEEDEYVEGVVIGECYVWWKENGCPKQIPNNIIDKVLSWDESKEWLDCYFDSKDGYGSVMCHPVYIWTNKRVFFITQYDTLTWLDSVPRYPVPCKPEIKGEEG